MRHRDHIKVSIFVLDYSTAYYLLPYLREGTEEKQKNKNLDIIED